MARVVYFYRVSDRDKRDRIQWSGIVLQSEYDVKAADELAEGLGLLPRTDGPFELPDAIHLRREILAVYESLKGSPLEAAAERINARSCQLRSFEKQGRPVPDPKPWFTSVWIQKPRVTT